MKKLLLFALVGAMIACGEKNDPVDPFKDKGVTINGVTWATRNVDRPCTFAAKPEDAGMFYQWGRNVGWSSTRPIVNSDGGTTWDDTIYEGDEWLPENDPCPKGWRVPTLDELAKLTDGTTYTWSPRNGIKGGLFTEKATGHAIFLPAAGGRVGLNLPSEGDCGFYWSATMDNDTYSRHLSFASSTVSVSLGIYRGGGFSVRCVAE